MDIVETPVFHKQVAQLFDNITYAEFREYLSLYPKKGWPIIGGGGIRKVRWKKECSGKSGGIRIIYFVKSKEKIYLLYGYSKSKKNNLSRKQVKQLKQVVEKL